MKRRDFIQNGPVLCTGPFLFQNPGDNPVQELKEGGRPE